MPTKPKKKVLGRGLDALIPKSPVVPSPQLQSAPKIDSEPDSERILNISIKQIRPNKNQPRDIFEEEKIKELSQSISEHGILQPILLRKDGVQFQIIAGERRFRASQLLGKDSIPAIVHQYDEEKSLEIALIENIQRENLNAIEEAKAYQQLISEFDLTQEQVAKRVGKNRSTVANLLRLLNLPKQIQNLLKENKLSMGHIRCLLALTNLEKQITLAEKAVTDGISVRELEKWVAQDTKAKAPKEPKPAKPGVLDDPDLRNYQERLQHRFQCKVSFSGSMKQGNIRLDYHSSDELGRLLELLGAIGPDQS